MATRSDALRGNHSLRERIIAAASKVFLEEGYEHLSMRRVAQEAGCSQMAMYRHFANKEALTQHICTELYARWAAKMKLEIEAAADPWERMRRFIEALIKFATSYPDHYLLTFLARHSNPEVIAQRGSLGEEFLMGIQDIVRAILAPGTGEDVVAMRLRQMMACLHGTAGLLLAHPKTYGLNKQRAIDDAKATVRSLLETPRPPMAE